MYDGAQWVSLGTLDLSSHLFTPAPSAVPPGVTIKPVTGSTYTILDGDKGKLLSFSNASASAVTLPQAGAGGNFASTWTAYASATGTGTVTITPVVSTVNGQSSLQLLPGQSALIVSDGTNYTALVMKLGTVTDITAGAGLTGGTIVKSGTLAIDKASSSDFPAATNNKVLTSDNIYTAEISIPYAASLSLNFGSFSNASITLTGNVTAISCSGQKANQSGVIRVIQDGVGGRTLPSPFGCNMRFVSGTQPIASTTPGTVDALIYQCLSPTYCLGSYQQNFR